MAVIQDHTPVRDSILWDLVRQFYNGAGVTAWSDGIVPMDITSNCYIADSYAAVVATFFRELEQEGNSRPPLIIELGGGSGRFAWQFLNRLFNYHFVDGEECIEFTYLLTDAAQTNVDNYASSPRFKPLVDAGVLSFGQLLVTPDPVIHTAEGPLTPADFADRPVIIIANYLFDAVPANLLRVRDNKIEQVHMRLETYDDEFLNQPITSFKSLTGWFESHPIAGSPTGNARLDAIVEQYTAYDDDFHVVVPEIAFAFLDKFLERETPLLMLAADLGTSSPDNFTLDTPFLFESYFAYYSNFHIFAEQFRTLGGDAQFQRYGSRNLCCGAYLLPGKQQWSALNLAQTKRQASAVLREFYPFDAHNVSEMIAASLGEAHIHQIQSWLRFSRYDPIVAENSLPLMMNEVQQTAENYDAECIYEMYMEAYRAFFPVAKDTLFDTGLARLFMAIGHVEPALQLLQQSTAEFGATAERLFVQALALFALEQRDAAYAKAKEALALDHLHGQALRFLAEQFNQADTAVATISPAKKKTAGYEHLRVKATDPDVHAKCIALLDSKGAVLIDDILPQDVITPLREALLDRADNWHQTGLGKPNSVGDRRQTVPLRVQHPFNDPMVFANPIILNVLTEIMGERPVLNNFGAVVTRAGARTQHVHREHPLLFNNDEANAAIPPYAFTILIPLIDLNEECGGTQLWEGTHRLPANASPEGESEVIYTKAGSILLFDYRTYHGGMPCNADHGRPMLYMSYTMPWFVDTLAFQSHAALGISDQERLAIPESYREMFKFAKRLAA